MAWRRFEGSIRELLQYDQIFFGANSILWIGYLFWHLKEAGMVQQSWISIMGVLGCVMMLGGSGAATGVGWLWREEVLANRKHKGAVVNESKHMEGQNGLVQSLSRTSPKM